MRRFGIPLLIATFGAIATGWFERRGRELFAASDIVLALCGIVMAIYLVAIYGTAARNSVGTPFVPIGVAFAATAGSAMILELTRRVAGARARDHHRGLPRLHLHRASSARHPRGAAALHLATLFRLRLYRRGHLGADHRRLLDLHHPLHHLRGLPAGLQGGRLFRELRLRRRRPRARRPGQGGDLRLRPDGHDQRHLRGQRGRHGLAHHPADEEGRLPEEDRRRDRGRSIDRRADHAAHHGGRAPSSWPRSPEFPTRRSRLPRSSPRSSIFVSIYFMVDFEAAKLGMRGMREDELPKFREMVRKVFLFPAHRDPDRGAFQWATR